MQRARDNTMNHGIVTSSLYIPYPRERGPTMECRPPPPPPPPHFGLNFQLRSSVHSNMRPCVATLENAAQMASF